MKLAIDDTDTADGNICVVTGAKDHYVKVSPSHCCISYTGSSTNDLEGHLTSVFQKM